MTDQEINEKVAKRLGWTDIKDGSELGYGIKWIGKNPNKKDPPSGWDGFDSLPDFCTSISAAWEVVEQAGPQYLFSLYRTLENYDGHRWACVFGDGTHKQSETADTAPMAI